MTMGVDVGVGVSIVWFQVRVIVDGCEIWMSLPVWRREQNVA